LLPKHRHIKSHSHLLLFDLEEVIMVHEALHSVTQLRIVGEFVQFSIEHLESHRGGEADAVALYISFISNIGHYLDELLERGLV
jgi:hypothetical protein